MLKWLTASLLHEHRKPTVASFEWTSSSLRTPQPRAQQRRYELAACDLRSCPVLLCACTSFPRSHPGMFCCFFFPVMCFSAHHPATMCSCRSSSAACLSRTPSSAWPWTKSSSSHGFAKMLIQPCWQGDRADSLLHAPLIISSKHSHHVVALRLNRTFKLCT